jgi:hypothetical protein
MKISTSILNPGIVPGVKMIVRLRSLAICLILIRASLVAEQLLTKTTRPPPARGYP